MIQLLTFFLAFLTLSVSSFGQDQSLVFQHLDIEDGLPDNSVRCIVEDKSGFMWFGTEGGICKFDGYKFTVYKHSTTDVFSPSSSTFKTLLCDSKGRLWLGGTNGINLYDKNHDRFLNHQNNFYAALNAIHEDVKSIIEDKEGNIWVASGNMGLYKISALDKAPERFNLDLYEGANDITSIAEDKDKSLWIGTNDGIFKFDPAINKFIDYRIQFGYGYYVRGLYIDGESIFVTSTSGLMVLNKTRKIFKKYQHNEHNPASINGNNTDIVVPYPYMDGKYLVSIDGGGIDVFDPKTEVFKHWTNVSGSQLSSNNITSIYIDSRKNVWAGTFLNGINYSNHSTNFFVFLKNDPANPLNVKKGIVTHFLKDSKNNFWVSTDGGGINVRKNGTENFVNILQSDKNQIIKSNAVTDVMEDQDGTIWIATYGGGLSRYNFPYAATTYMNDPKNPGSIASNRLKSLCEYNNEIWATSYGSGILVFNKKTSKFRSYTYNPSAPDALASDWVLKAFVDSRGTLWIGTNTGLCKYMPETDSFKTYSFDPTKKSDLNFVFDIYEDSKKNLWVGTITAGLILFDRDKERATRFTTADGLSENCVRNIIEDDFGSLWLAGNYQITKFNIHTKKGKPYGLKEGVPPCSYFFDSKYKDELGRLYLGANNGYLVIDPSLSSRQPDFPNVVITGLNIFNTPYKPDSACTMDCQIWDKKTLILDHNQNSLTFAFAALNFNCPSDNSYVYKLERFEQDWVKSGTNHTATYTNLNPGRYVFKVKATDQEGVWGQNEKCLEVIILSPFWKSWWFILIEIGLGILLLYLLDNWRITRIKTINIALEEKIRQRTKEIKETNEHLEAFVYKASHDIKGPLKSIIGLTSLGLIDLKDQPAATKYLEHILKSTKKLDHLLLELLQLTKVRQATIKREIIHLEEIIQDAFTSFENLPEYKKMAINIDIEKNIEFYSDKNILSSIIQNLIENPIKYHDPAKPEPYLNIHAYKNKNAVVITFEDNGLGIAPEYQDKIFDMFFKVSEKSNGTGLGLYIVKTSVEKLKGTVRVESQQGRGTTFYLTF